jgi:hypothetical protein
MVSSAFVLLLDELTYSEIYDLVRKFYEKFSFIYFFLIQHKTAKPKGLEQRGNLF